MIWKIGGWGGGFAHKTRFCVEMFYKIEYREGESSYMQGRLLFVWIRCLYFLAAMRHLWEMNKIHKLENLG
jgi:hypothetical protein